VTEPEHSCPSMHTRTQAAWTVHL